jgi:CheY-like chemotaxis protein
VVSYQLTKSDRVQVRITDTGPGIPPEKLSRLFMPFDRLDAERSGIEGTGLGLSLSRRLVEAMHGLIGVDSALGKGSSFWVELPLAQSPLERLSSNKPRQTETSQARTEKKRTILYIEDNRSNLTLIEQVLAEDPQTRLLSAMQGRLGIDLARQHSPDVVLLDLHLPDMPGWEVLSELQRNEATKHLPVIVISADATSRQINKLMAAGAYSYLTKPLNVDQFFKTIEKASNRTEATNGAVAVASVPATQP